MCNLTDICVTGPEKLLEIWFTPSPELLPPSASPEGLKCVSKERWEQMLDIVQCKVLSVLKNEHVDAYLLSESSMFVFPHKVILKTCGTTTLLNGLREMLRIASEEAGFGPGGRALATPYRVFYSRKSFMFPDKQMHPHKSWRDEVEYLDQWFINGSAYMVGKMNGEHWYLYLTNPGNTLSPPLTPTNEPADPLERHETETQLIDFPQAQDIVYKNIGGGRDGGSGNGIFDETLEVLMTDLDQVKAKQFYLENASAVAAGQYRRRKDEERSKGLVSVEEQDVGSDDLPEELTSEGHVLGSIVSEACGLDGVYPRSTYPGAMVDSYLFTPCGFSANAIIPSPDPKIPTTHYFTVHVTPEPHCSYASFETNVPGRQSGRGTAEILEHVVGIFRPGRFSVTLFEAKPATVDRGARDNIYDLTAVKRSARMDCIKGYRRVDKIRHDLDGYDLVFRYYERDDWKGGAKPVLRDF